MREIFLTQGRVALVDDDQYKFLNQWKWYANKMGNTFYAMRNSSRINGKQYTILMHHEIIGRPPKGFEIDHRNGRRTDNQRHNLRFVTRRQNTQNRKNIVKSSQYPGVSWIKRDQRFQAKITINNKQKHLGYFIKEREAFKAYCQAVEELGEKMLEGAKNIVTHAE